MTFLKMFLSKTIFDFLKRAAHDKQLLENLIPLTETENEF